MEVTLIEDLAANVRIQLSQPPDLAVLLRDEFLVHRGDLDEEIVVRQIEVGTELPDWCPGSVPFEREGPRLVLPRHDVEVEQSREFPLTGMGELNPVCRFREQIVRQ